MIRAVFYGDDDRILGEYRARPVDIPAEEVEGQADDDTVEGWLLTRLVTVNVPDRVAMKQEAQLPRRGVYHETAESAVMFALQDALS